MQSHIRKTHACLAVTCHLHFWQNDGDLLCITAVTRVWNAFRNKSQHRLWSTDHGEETSPAAPMGSDESRFNVSLIVKEKVAIQSPQITILTEKGEPKRHRTLLLTSLTPYR